MARSTASQVVQIGDETVRGTAVPADRTLASLSFALSPEVDVKTFRPRGTKYTTVVAPNREWTSGDLDGTPTYDELIYPLASVMTRPVTTPVAGATGAFQHVFEPSSTAGDNPATYTVEQGDANHAARATHVLVTDFSLEFSRSDVSLSGSAFGTALDRTVTLTAAPTPVADDLVPILPGQVCLYVSDDPATLGTEGTHITNGLSVSPSLGSRFDPVWYLNCREDSFSGYIETPEPEATLDLVAEADAGGIAWSDHFRTGATRYLRIEATGPRIDPASAASAYRLTLDYAVKVREPGEEGDEDGVYAVHPSLEVVHSPAWGRAYRATLVNTVAAL